MPFNQNDALFADPFFNTNDLDEHIEAENRDYDEREALREIERDIALGRLFAA